MSVSWLLGDGRLKCQSCGTRYRSTSVWDAVRLSPQQKQQLLASFCEGRSAYQAKFTTGPCVDSTERFYRLVRACCALRAPLDENAVSIARMNGAGSRGRWMRGWSGQAQVVLVGIAESESGLQLTAPPAGFHECLSMLPTRAALGAVFRAGSRHSVVSLALQGEYVTVPRGSSRSLSMTQAEQFWNFARQRLQCFRKMPARYFRLYLAETWVRYHHGDAQFASLVEQWLRNTSYTAARETMQGMELSSLCSAGGRIAELTRQDSQQRIDDAMPAFATT
jgi:transposase